MKLLLDEMYPQRIAAEMRKHGHDVIGVDERPELRSLDDESLLLTARSEGRVLVTENVVDFPDIIKAFALEGRSHAGVILVPSTTFARTARGWGVLVRALDAYLRAHSEDRVVAEGVHWLRP